MIFRNIFNVDNNFYGLYHLVFINEEYFWEYISGTKNRGPIKDYPIMYTSYPDELWVPFKEGDLDGDL